LIFGFHPLTDFYSPKKMLEETVRSEKFGFDEIYYADHFHPWTVAEGTSFAWTLIASAAERTSRVKIGTAVTCPFLRYHPAIVAQAFASLASTYEGRIFLGVGTGEALNEAPPGFTWPRGQARLEMFEEAIQIIKELWKGDYVSFKGKYFTIDNARLFTKPASLPLYISALGPKAAYIAGRWGEGWITLNLPEDRVRDLLIPAFERGLQDKIRLEGDRYPVAAKPRKIAEIVVSYDGNLDRAIEACRPFAGTLSPDVFQNRITDPREIKALGDRVKKNVLAERMLTTDNEERIISAIEKFQRLGFDTVEIASLSPDQNSFFQLFHEKVKPVF
jgi:G6PDH family F420-dependent oxidoreductase